LIVWPASRRILIPTGAWARMLQELLSTPLGLLRASARAQRRGRRTVSRRMRSSDAKLDAPPKPEAE